jgi:hypothetical protein
MSRGTSSPGSRAAERVAKDSQSTAGRGALVGSTDVCGHYHRKGTTVCTNRRVLPMVATNAEVLRSIERTCLSPVAVERIVEGALAALAAPREALTSREAALRATLTTLEAEIARYTAAVGQAPDLASLLDALQTRERQRATLRTELEGLRRLREAGPIDRRVLDQRVRAVVADWLGLMGRQVSEARRLLKGFLEGRVMFTPRGDEATVDFAGRVQMGPLLVGAVLPLVGGVLDGTRPLYPGVPRRASRIADRLVKSASRARRRLALGAKRADRPARAV